jgi:hypothetical protein
MDAKAGAVKPRANRGKLMRLLLFLAFICLSAYAIFEGSWGRAFGSLRRAKRLLPDETKKVERQLEDEIDAEDEED